MPLYLPLPHLQGATEVPNDIPLAQALLGSSALTALRPIPQLDSHPLVSVA